MDYEAEVRSEQSDESTMSPSPSPVPGWNDRNPGRSSRAPKELLYSSLVPPAKPLDFSLGKTNTDNRYCEKTDLQWNSNSSTSSETTDAHQNHNETFNNTTDADRSSENRSESGWPSPISSSPVDESLKAFPQTPLVNPALFSGLCDSLALPPFGAVPLGFGAPSVADQDLSPTTALLQLALLQQTAPFPCAWSQTPEVETRILGETARSNQDYLTFRDQFLSRKRPFETNRGGNRKVGRRSHTDDVASLQSTSDQSQENYSTAHDNSIQSTQSSPDNNNQENSSQQQPTGGCDNARGSRAFPDALKDSAYWERRRRNNEAAKRSRDARRAREDEIAIRAAFLEQEAIRLKVELAAARQENLRMRTILQAART